MRAAWTTSPKHIFGRHELAKYTPSEACCRQIHCAPNMRILPPIVPTMVLCMRIAGSSAAWFFRRTYCRPSVPAKRSNKSLNGRSNQTDARKPHEGNQIDSKAPFLNLKHILPYLERRHGRNNLPFAGRKNSKRGFDLLDVNSNIADFIGSASRFFLLKSEIAKLKF